jgi:hypothetical protein
MKGEILFRETQKFRQWWVWLILLAPAALVAIGVFQQVVLGKPFGNKPSDDAGLLLVFGLTLFMIISFFSLRLETIIREDGIYVKFFPFHLSFRHYGWDQIQKSYVRKYNPILEYGGWGLRGLGKNRALNVSGNQGLQLNLGEGKSLLIGTNKPEEINEVLQKVQQ